MDHFFQVRDVFNKGAGLYEEKYMDISPYHQSLDVVLERLPQRAEVLDVGCGPGNISRYLLTHQPHLRVLGIDIAPRMLELAARNNPTAEYQLLDCRDIVKLNKIFDGIVCGFVLPYLSTSEISNFIRETKTLLSSGGIVYVSFMEGRYADSGWVTSATGSSLYICYHEPEWISEVFQLEGFLEIFSETIDPAPGSSVSDVVSVYQLL